MQSVADSYLRLDNPYQAQRGADVVDIGNRVLRRLMAVDVAGQEIGEPSIVFAEELMPAELAQLDPEEVGRIVTVRGGVNSHSAILSGTLGLPAVMGVPATLFGVTPGTVVAVDGELGQVWLDPTPELLADMQHRREAWLARQASSRQVAQRAGYPARWAAHRRCRQHQQPGRRGPGAAGRRRRGASSAPNIFTWATRTALGEEQLAVSHAISKRLDGRPLVVRTLDVGGDKALPYLPMPEENNPFLGIRGLRYCLEHPGLLKARFAPRSAGGRRIPVKLISRW